MPPRNKKAKLGEHTGENGTSSSRKKVIESLRGTLSYMVTDVPLELLAKIFSYLLPVDLINLSRANKALRGILMSRSARPIWIASLNALTDLSVDASFPECPSSMKEPQFVHFIFDAACHFCQSKSKYLTTAWDYQFKVCNKCVPKEFEVTYRYTREPDSPSIRFTKGGQREKVEMFEWPEELAKFEAEKQQLPLKDRPAFTQKRVKLIHTWRKISTQYDEWELGCKRKSSLDRQDAITRLKRVMKGRLCHLGWSLEFSRNSSVRVANVLWIVVPDWDDISEPLADPVWKALQPKLVSALDELRVIRIKSEAVNRLGTAINALNTIHQTLVSVTCIVPPVGELFYTLPFQQAIFNLFQASGDLEPDLEAEKQMMVEEVNAVAAEHLPLLLDEWVVDKKRFIWGLLPKEGAVPDIVDLTVGEGSSAAPDAIDLTGMECSGTVEDDFLKSGSDHSQVPTDASHSPAKPSPDDAEIDRVLSLATSVFYVGIPREQRIGLGYGAVLSKSPFNFLQLLTDTIVHAPHPSVSSIEQHRDTTLRLSEAQDAAARVNMLKFCPKADVWSKNCVFFFAELVPVVESVLVHSGLDPATATHGDLGNVSGVLLRCQCQTCEATTKRRVFDGLCTPSRLIEHWTTLLSKYQSDYVSGSDENQKDVRELLAVGATDFAVPVEGEMLAHGLLAMRGGAATVMPN